MKKIKTRTKLVGAVAALTVAVALSAGTTFAWFTTNSTAKISSISANIVSGSDNNIMIAVGHGTSEVTFKTSISTTDLASYVKDTTELDAITINGTDATTGAVTFSDKKSSTITAGTQYIKIPLTIKTDAAADIILNTGTVTGASTSSTSIISDWKNGISKNSYGTHNDIKNEPIYAYADNAVRIGFTTASGTLSSMQYQTEGSIYVWSPNEAKYDGSQINGYYNSKDYKYYSDSSYENELEVDRDLSADSGNYWMNNLAGDYYDYIEGNDSSTVECNGYENILTLNGEDSNNSTIVRTKQDGTASCYAYVYMYIWIEGTDGDCFNSILDQSISISMSLTMETISDAG